MDLIKTYQVIVKKILHEYAQHRPQNGEIETQLLFDDEKGHYYLMRVGWDGLRRVHACAIHLDIKDDKIWVQQDWTEYGIANELVDAGIAKSAIVLAFHAPYKRPYTGFAIA